MRKVKLTTEWVTWAIGPEDTVAWLRGAADYVAVIYLYTSNPAVYVRLQSRQHAPDRWRYAGAERETLASGTTLEEAQAYCEQKLLENGLIDLLWWVSQETS